MNVVECDMEENRSAAEVLASYFKTPKQKIH